MEHAGPGGLPGRALHRVLELGVGGGAGGASRASRALRAFGVGRVKEVDGPGAKADQRQGSRRVGFIRKKKGRKGEDLQKKKERRNKLWLRVWIWVWIWYGYGYG